MFAEEQCDQRQILALDENWLGRLDDKDRNEYWKLARVALEAAVPFLAGAAGLDPECGCMLRGCVHRPALTEEARHRMSSGEPTQRQQDLANAVVALNVSFDAAAAEAARQFAPAAEAFNQGVVNFSEAVRRAQQNRGMTR